MTKIEAAKRWFGIWRWKIWHLRNRFQYRLKRIQDKIDLARQIGAVTCLESRRLFRTRYRTLRRDFGDKVKKGRLEAFAETGTEGFCWSVYEDGKSGYAGLNPIGKNDRLIIFNHDGSIAFEGVIDPDFEVGYQPYPLNPQYGQPCAFGGWIHWTQRGWEVEDWARLFMRDMLDDSPDKIPLRAIIVKDE